MKKFLVFLLSLTICLTPTLVFASAAEKWEILENNYDHAKNTVNLTAKKVSQQAANSGVYKVQVPVNASTLGSTVKMMLKGGVASAALYGLVEGVGWIIDEGSKVIKKPLPADLPQVDKFWLHDNLAVNYNNYIQFGGTTAMAACQNIAPQYSSFGKVVSVTLNGSWASCNFERQGFSQTVSQRDNQWKDQNAEPKFDIISDAQLGDLILGKSTEPNAPTSPQSNIITDAYSPNNPVSDAPAPQETNQALENANPQPEKEPEGKSETEKEKDETGAETGKETSKFELPNFCEWAPSVCDFFTVQKQDNKEIKENQKLDTEQNKTFFEKVSDFFDWTKKDPEQDNSDNDLPVTTPEPFDTSIFSKDRFSVSRQCPVPEQHTISLSGISVNFAFDLKPICSVLELARPALIACSYLYACYIVIGAARNG